MISDAIDHYHSLLSDEALLTRTQELFQAQLEKRRLYFGSVPVCRVLRPQFYTSEQWEYLQSRTQIILSAFMKAHAACMENSDLRAQLDLEPFEEALLSVDLNVGVTVPWSSSRLDAFYRPESGYLRFVEYNAETPAGIGYGDQLTDMFLAMPVMDRFKEKYTAQHLYGMPRLMDVLLRGYHDWGGRGKPQIAIADWQHVPTLNEHDISKDYFERHGCPTIKTDPRDMEYRGGHLWVEDFRVDMIYKRVLISELVREVGMDAPVMQAIRNKAVFITNSFSAKMMAKKASLAFLSDEFNAHLFTLEERAAIEQHIPWTRRVMDRTTIYQGREVDLLPFIAEHREQFVIKPNDEYGGHGVVIGWECNPEDWEAAIKNALNNPHVVQEKVTIVERDFPMMIDGKLDISPRYVDANPYVYYGESIGGCLTRLSSAALLNVTAGSGSVVPMFVVDSRD